MALPKQLLARCPACFTNFINLYCDFTCGPSQSTFMSANTTGTFNVLANIESVNYVVGEDFAEGMFQSCKDVQMPSNNQKALGVLCGRDASACTPQNWLDYMGDKDNHQTPFQINFNISASPITFGNVTLHPMDYPTIPCNGSCSCQDCKLSCGTPPPTILPKEPWEILGLEAFDFLAASTYACFVLIFGTFLIWYCLMCRPPNSYLHEASEAVFSVNNHPHPRGSVPQVTSNDISCWQRMHERFEGLLGRAFSAWGRLCARHPVAVLIGGVLCCLVLSCGLALFKITTDPVELWSAPDSRARLEKNYFDTHFTWVLYSFCRYKSEQWNSQ